jgi:hypothetical protein
MVDKSHKYFAVEYAGNIIVKRLHLAFNYSHCKYLNIMTTNETTFINNIIINLYNSTIIENIEEILSETQKKEYYMKCRLKEKCKELDILYADNNNNHTTIDCYINNIPIQLKYASLNQTHRNTIQVTMRKSCGSIQSKKLKQSYHIDDEFEYVIIELGESHNNFCIIPKQELANKKCISTNEINGSGMCYLMPFNNGINHWTNEYWNKWDYLTNK